MQLFFILWCVQAFQTASVLTNCDFPGRYQKFQLGIKIVNFSAIVAKYGLDCASVKTRSDDLDRKIKFLNIISNMENMREYDSAKRLLPGTMEF